VMFFLRAILACLLIAGWSILPAQALPVDACHSNAAVSQIESRIQQVVAASRWLELQTAGLELTHLCPNSDFGYHWLGVAYLREGRTFAAARTLEQSLQHRDDAGAHLLLAEAYFKLGQKKFFWEEIEAAQRLLPEEAGVYYLAGLFRYQTEDAFGDAAMWFRQALSKNANHMPARCYLALCLRAQQKNEDAETLLLEGIRKLPTMDSQSVMPLQLLVSLELDLDRPADALEHAKTAARLAPKVAKVQLGLGKAALAMHDLPTARAALLATTALEPDVPESFYLLSRVYAAQGDQRSAEQALASFKQLREQYHGAN